MSNEIEVNVHSINDITNFVVGINKFESDIDAIVGSITYDAKSLMGIAVISNSPFKVRINSDDIQEIQEFTDFCETYKAVLNE